MYLIKVLLHTTFLKITVKQYQKICTLPLLERLEVEDRFRVGCLLEITHAERKLLTVIQHNNRKGRSPSLAELQMRIGYNNEDIKRIINNLIQKDWLKQKDGNLIIKKTLF